MINSNQIKRIHILKSLLKIDDELYREILSGYGAKTCKSLEPHLASELIDQLQNMADEAGVAKKFKNPNIYLADREGMATPAQISKVQLLWKEVAYKKDKKFLKASLRKFLEKQFKISDVRFIEKTMVSKIIKSIEVINAKSNSVQNKVKEK